MGGPIPLDQWDGNICFISPRSEEAHTEDSEPEWDSEAGTAGSDGEKGGLLSAGYGEGDFTHLDGDEEGYEEEEDGNSRQPEDDNSQTEKPEAAVLTNCKKLYKWKIKEGIDMNYIIQNKKEFCNPSIYEKLIQFCSIDESGTNYPKDMFDPHSWSEDSYYEALAKAQKTEMDKFKKAKKEHTKIEFVTGIKRGGI
ncbi:SAP30-binding protein [Lonchura striata]|uniref:SAP30-binding protein n=1 Tax=Lonchura striata TaxID=40157 RepID=A0A218UHZ1_9PASE|nr:SAP30-binding protein [Lonchura striata domestica]